MKPVLHEAAAYLSALTWRNGWNAPNTFFTVDDRKKDSSLTQTIHGSLAELADQLVALNESGAGIFVTVNMTDGRGRKSENVQSVRALFIDMDGPMRREPPLRPTMTVRTRNGSHLFWVLWEGEPITGFTPGQEQLARFYGSDPVVKDLPRVMRLPGFCHVKDEPFLVRLEECHPHLAYGMEQVLTAHPAPEPFAFVPTFAPPVAIHSYRKWASCHEVVVGTRNRTAFSIACDGFRRGLTDEEVWLVLSEWAQRADIISEADDILRSAKRYVARRTA